MDAVPNCPSQTRSRPSDPCLPTSSIERRAVVIPRILQSGDQGRRRAAGQGVSCRLFARRRKKNKSYLLAGISAAGDDGDSADLEELHLVLPVGGRVCG